jgi:protein-L-isoaspartate(D-aspartate) O-methyltransferase
MRGRLIALAAVAVVWACARADGQGASRTPFSERVAERDDMVRDSIQSRGVRDPRVLGAMRRVPRHAFVPRSVRAEAYEDRPLPIGHDQTISQPYIVAAMTEAARPQRKDKCLEIGTGSGYQAAVLAELCAVVYTIEYLAEVAELGKANLTFLGYAPERVKTRVGDGYRGWPEAAPFDVIVVTAAPDHVPQPLLDQLSLGGRMVIPVGPQSTGQDLLRWVRIRAGNGPDAWTREKLMDVRFVPFLGEAAEKR